MNRAIFLLGAALPALAACAALGPVQPSPTTDQVLAAQYRARAEQGAMSGAESQAVMEAYRRDIAKPTASSGNTHPDLNAEPSSH
jgi:hypothetical protein